MIKRISILYAKLTDINAKLCCLCHNYVNDESACVQDVVLLGPNSDDDAKELFSEEEIGIHYILEQILGTKVAAYLSEHDPICNMCLLLAVSSYKFIKICRENVESMAYLVADITNNIKLIEGLDIQDYKTVFINMDVEESKHTHYYDTAKFVDSNSALYKFHILFRPYRIRTDDKGNSKYKCTKCKSVSHNQSSALQHFNVKHTAEQDISSKTEIKNNVSDEENNICTDSDDFNDNPNAPYWNKCSNKDYVTRRNELSHEVINIDGVNKYKCRLCYFVCSKAIYARRHYKTKHVLKSKNEYDTRYKRRSNKDETDKTEAKSIKPEFLTEFNYCKERIKHLNQLSHTVIKDSSGCSDLSV